MALHLTPAAREQIITHAEAGYPNEVCGILLGSGSDDLRTISQAFAIENAFEAGEQYHRFLITPEDMFRAERLARQRGLEVFGVYHTHPDEEARPSTYDRDHAAWTSWNYIVVSVEHGQATSLRAWKLRPDRDAFDEEPVTSDQSE